jgi:hypothetical protein
VTHENGILPHGREVNQKYVTSLLECIWFCVGKKDRKSRKSMGSNCYDPNAFGFVSSVGNVDFCVSYAITLHDAFIEMHAEKCLTGLEIA